MVDTRLISGRLDYDPSHHEQPLPPRRHEPCHPRNETRDRGRLYSSWEAQGVGDDLTPPAPGVQEAQQQDALDKEETTETDQYNHLSHERHLRPSRAAPPIECSFVLLLLLLQLAGEGDKGQRVQLKIRLAFRGRLNTNLLTHVTPTSRTCVDVRPQQKPQETSPQKSGHIL